MMMMNCVIQNQDNDYDDNDDDDDEIGYCDDDENGFALQTKFFASKWAPVTCIPTHTD